MKSALVFEWRRLWSVRATWIMLLVFVSANTFFGIFPLFSARQEGMQSWIGLYNTPANFLSLVLISVVAAQVFGHEYRYGTIRLTLTEFPKREVVLFAISLNLLFFTLPVFTLAAPFFNFTDPAAVISDSCSTSDKSSWISTSPVIGLRRNEITSAN